MTTAEGVQDLECNRGRESFSSHVTIRTSNSTVIPGEIESSANQTEPETETTVEGLYQGPENLEFTLASSFTPNASEVEVCAAKDTKFSRNMVFNEAAANNTEKDRVIVLPVTHDRTIQRPRGFLSTFFICRYCLHFVAVYTLVATGCAAAFLRGFVELTHVRVEKASLEKENVIFSALLKEREKIQSDLAGKIEDLEQQNVEYEKQNAVFKILNEELNATAEELDGLVTGLSEQVTNLESSNTIFAGLNTDLNKTTADLQEAVLGLGGELSGLNATAADLKESTDKLQEQLNELNRTATILGEEVKKISTVIGFLEDNAESNQSNFTKLVETLADMIFENQAILNEIRWHRLRRDYATNVNQGLEELRIYFNVLSGFNLSALVGDLFDEVLEEVDTDVLGEICGDSVDFEFHMKISWGEPGTLKFTHILESTFAYTDKLQKFYFPEDVVSGSEGITSTQWKDAGYKCTNLDPQVVFYV